MTTVIIYGHKHKQLEGKLMGTSHSRNNTIAAASPMGPMTPLAMGLCPDL